MRNDRKWKGTRGKNGGRIWLFALVLLALLGGLMAAALRFSASSVSAVSGHPIRLSELMSSNRSYPNVDGRTPDWIELHNTADYAIDLNGYRLTDNNRKIRYTFPSGAHIEADGYYVVYCEKNMPEGDYADFAVDKAGGEAILLLSARSVVVDSLETVALKTDEAMARAEDGSWTVLGFGTPGYPNTQEGYRAYLSAHREEAALLQINEIQSGNAGYPDEAGQLYDWIELWNAGTTDLDISGYRLSDKRTSPGYSFPDGTTIPAGGYFVLYCNRDAAGDTYARFSLSTEGGETVTLWNRADMVLDEVVTIPLETNTSMIPSEGGWKSTGTPSPGYENSEAGHAAYVDSRRAGDADFRITEVMPANGSTLADTDGDFSDWIEVTNCGDSAASLAGWSLCDRADDTARWKLPEATLAPGARLIVFASGKDRIDAAEPHTNFSLDRLGESVYLFSPKGMLISSLSWSALLSDQSVYADETTGEAHVAEQPTPGLPNDDSGRTAFADSTVSNGPLAINEVMSGNGTLLQQKNDKYYDWVELKNVTAETLRLSDYYISDSANEKLQCRLPEVELGPGELYVVLCDSAAADTTDVQAMALSLNAVSDSLFLSDANGGLIDFTTVHGLTLEGSYGRMNGQNGYFYFASPTPGKENEDGFRAVSAMPTALTPAGLYKNGPVSVELSGVGDIYYTLDGSVPTAGSALYAAPLTVTQNTVIRAVCIETDKLASRVLTVSYLIGTTHDLPVVCVSTDPDNITGDNGILAVQNRFDRSVERYAHIEFFDGERGFSSDCAIKLHGGVSRERSLGGKHSFKVVFRPRYGGAPLEYPLYDDGVTQFYSLLLRSGEDSPCAVVRDELITGIAYQESEGLLVMDSRYCVLYLNGEYRGLYALKESLSSGFYSVHYGVTKDSVDMHRADIEESDDYLSLYRYVSEHDMSVAENYRYVEERIDLTGMVDWCIFEAYSANSDIGVNVRFYRSTEGDGKWRYALYDIDDGMNRSATFHYIMAGGTNLIPRKLVKNEEYKKLFLTRLAYHLQNGLSEENVLKELDSLCGQIRSEMKRERERWPVSGNRGWEDHVEALRKQIMADRAALLKAEAASYLKVSQSEVDSYFQQGGAA